MIISPTLYRRLTGKDPEEPLSEEQKRQEKELHEKVIKGIDRDIYTEIASQDNFPVDNSSYGSINRKDSDVSISLYCRCGYEGYYDGDYFGYYGCPQCHVKYAVGQRVKLIPLDEHQIEEIGETQFKTCLVSTGEIAEFQGWDDDN